MTSPLPPCCHSELWDDAPWTWLLDQLPSDLDARAQASGALRRRRRVRAAADLVRLALAYALSGWSLRLVAAWATARGLAELSDVALLGRLRRAEPWLGALVAGLVGLGRAATGAGPVRLRLVDATTVSRPGSGGADWRVHLSVSLDPPMIDGLEVTDGRGAEALVHHPAGPGDIQVADRGHARRADLGQVIRGGADLVVRIGWQNLPLLDAGGRPLDLLGWLGALPATPGERAVQIASPQGTAPLRLVAQRLADEAAAAARRRLRRTARKKGRTPDQRSLVAAGYVVLVTTLAAAEWPATEVLALYRVRWQVELAIKRLKGLWQLDHLRAHDPALARAALLGTLLGALLAERATHPAPLPCAAWFLARERPLSLWRWQQLWHAVLRDAVLGPLTPTVVLAAVPGLQRHLCDPPRRRPQQAAHARHALHIRCLHHPRPLQVA